MHMARGGGGGGGGVGVHMARGGGGGGVGVHMARGGGGGGRRRSAHGSRGGGGVGVNSRLAWYGESLAARMVVGACRPDWDNRYSFIDLIGHILASPYYGFNTLSGRVDRSCSRTRSEKKNK